jgi:hypothetical protein
MLKITFETINVDGTNKRTVMETSINVEYGSVYMKYFLHAECECQGGYDTYYDNSVYGNELNTKGYIELGISALNKIFMKEEKTKRCHDTNQPDGSTCLEGTKSSNKCAHLKLGRTWLNCECGGKCDETE